MSEELQDEITSINSIYGASTLESIEGETGIYTLTLPARPSIALRLEFPSDYPDAPPSVLGTQSIGSHVAKGVGTGLVEHVRRALADVYMPGAPCVFDLIEECNPALEQQSEPRSGGAVAAATQDAHADGQHAPSDLRERNVEGVMDDADAAQQPLPTASDEGPPPPWILSEVVTEKKSVFVARAAAVTSVDQAREYLAHLLYTDKKVARATHNITAWRIRGDGGVQYQDCDDDGETAAGGRLLHLLELMNVWDVMVVVTRWYGGVQLGPDRFRIINQTARDAVIRGGYVEAPGKDGKKKGKKS